MFNSSEAENISVHDIELFLTVAKQGSVSNASRQLYISQSALSIKIRQFEDKLGYDLFERTNHGVELTAKGMALYTMLHNTYHQFRVSMNQIIHMNDPEQSKRIYIGGLHMKCITNAMLNVCNAYSSRPNTRSISLEYYRYHVLYSMLLCRELDLVFTLSFEVEGKDEFSSIRLFPVDFQFIFPSQWNIKELNAETRAFLSDKPLLSEIHNGVPILKTYCSENGISVKKLVRAGAFLEMLNMVSEGKGFTVWESYFPSIFAERGGVSSMPAPNTLGCPKVYVCLAWRRDDDNNPEIQKLVGIASGIDFPNVPFLASDGDNNNW